MAPPQARSIARLDCDCLRCVWWPELNRDLASTAFSGSILIGSIRKGRTDGPSAGRARASAAEPPRWGARQGWPAEGCAG